MEIKTYGRHMEIKKSLPFYLILLTAESWVRTPLLSLCNASKRFIIGPNLLKLGEKLIRIYNSLINNRFGLVSVRVKNNSINNRFGFVSVRVKNNSILIGFSQVAFGYVHNSGRI